jgi:integrase/recombinase XerC
MTSTSPTVQWEDAIEAWLTTLRGAGRRPATIEARRQQLGMLAKWARRRGRGPWTLSTDDLLSWMASRDWGRERRRTVRSALRTFYTWGVRTRRILDNPTTDLPKVRQAEPRPKPCSDAVLGAAVNAAPARDVLMLRLAAECGLRRGEVAVVHTRDIAPDLLGWSLTVHGKGGKERTVPLEDDLAQALLRRPRGYVFPGRIEGHLSARWVGRVVLRWLAQGYTLHSLRHWFATTTYHEDNDLLAVQQMLGHASPETTRRYIKLQDDRTRRLAVTASARLRAVC